MNNTLFNFEGHEVEVINFNGVALFNPRHVGECLELGESAVKMAICNMNQNQVVKITNDMISKVNSIDFRKLHNTGENFLTTSGVYQLVFKSRKPNAKKFQDWVTDVVLPSIETYGAYIPGNTPEQIVNNGMNAMSGMVPEDQYMSLVNSFTKTYDDMKRMETQMYLDRFKHLRTDVIYEGADVYYQVGEDKFKMSEEELHNLLISLQFIHIGRGNEILFNTTKILSINPLKLTYKGFVELCYNLDNDGKLIYHLK